MNLDWEKKEIYKLMRSGEDLESKFDSLLYIVQNIIDELNAAEGK